MAYPEIEAIVRRCKTHAKHVSWSRARITDIEESISTCMKPSWQYARQVHTQELHHHTLNVKIVKTRLFLSGPGCEEAHACLNDPDWGGKKAKLTEAKFDNETRDSGP